MNLIGTSVGRTLSAVGRRKIITNQSNSLRNVAFESITTTTQASHPMKMKSDDLQRNRKVSIQSRLNIKHKSIGNLNKNSSSILSSPIRQKPTNNEKMCSVFDRLGFT